MYFTWNIFPAGAGAYLAAGETWVSACCAARGSEKTSPSHTAAMRRRRLNAFIILTATVFMAGITSSASAVDVGRIALVALVHPGLWMARAIRAGKRLIVRRIRMANRADTVCAAVIDAPEIVCKCRPKPI